jgi:hypothetical protein
LARALVQPSSWRRMGLRWTATATSMSARCRGPTGRKLSETSHGLISCARCTSSGRWYKKSPRNSLLLHCEISAHSMSALGQERRTKLGSGFVRSALPPKADNRADISLCPLRANSVIAPRRRPCPLLFAGPAAPDRGGQRGGSDCASSCLMSAARDGGTGAASASYWSLNERPIAASPTCRSAAGALLGVAQATICRRIQ